MKGIITGNSMTYRNNDILLPFKSNYNSNLLLVFIQPLVGNYKFFFKVFIY